MPTITSRTDDEVDRALREEAARLARDPANLAEIKAVQEELAEAALTVVLGLA